MAKTYVNTVKYNIICEFQIKGVVDNPDIVGAIFGQSEGLLGEEMDLRELQKNGRIGRIEIKHRSQGGVTRGSITIPSSMDMVETSLLAAAMETVDKVGPCEAKFNIKTIDDTRASKREVVASRAQELLAKMRETQVPDSMELAEQVRETTRAGRGWIPSSRVSAASRSRRSTGGPSKPRPSMTAGWRRFRSPPRFRRPLRRAWSTRTSRIALAAAPK